ncbi:homoserine kinase [Leuconostoc koreense]|nr:homoserine kinase [Leuconostoc mesenteroides]QGM25626.1 homoserine kinase [Leuconostoc mesenteroides subsp. mesenteroides]
MIKITVPATSANIGPGFDSLGVALKLYLTLEVHEKTSEWQVIHDYGENMPSDMNNFIVKTAILLAPNLTPHRIVVKSDIPLARGLGSSSSALLAGLAMANVLADLGLSDDALLKQATTLEGHPDNVAPALLGGSVAAFYDGEQVYHAPLSLPKDINFLTFIPNYELLTTEARHALPANMTFKNSVAASAISNTLVAALTTGDFNTARVLIEKDQFHEQARAYLAPHLKIIRDAAHQLDIVGTYLSGAGPTVITLVPQNNAIKLLKKLTNMALPGKLLLLEPDYTGLQIIKNN